MPVTSASPAFKALLFRLLNYYSQCAGHLSVSNWRHFTERILKVSQLSGDRLFWKHLLSGQFIKALLFHSLLRVSFIKNQCTLSTIKVQKHLFKVNTFSFSLGHEIQLANKNTCRLFSVPSLYQRICHLIKQHLGIDEREAPSNSIPLVSV